MRGLSVACMCLVVCLGCTSPMPCPEATYIPEEAIHQGYWTAYYIAVPDLRLTLHTKLGMKGLSVPTKVVKIDDKWYVYDHGSLWDQVIDSSPIVE